MTLCPSVYRLTAFVLRAFGRAKSFIYIDPQVIEISKLWLENRQEPDGSFMRMGKLFNNRMKVFRLSHHM